MSGIIYDLHNKVWTLYLKVVKITNHSQRKNINRNKRSLFLFFSFLFLFSTFDSFNLKSHRPSMQCNVQTFDDFFIILKNIILIAILIATVIIIWVMQYIWKLKKLKNVHLSVSLGFTVFNSSVLLDVKYVSICHLEWQPSFVAATSH